MGLVATMLYDPTLIPQSQKTAINPTRTRHAVAGVARDSRQAIPFNKPYMTGAEAENIGKAYAFGHLAGDGSFTKKCHAWLERNTGAHAALLTQSCTAALEMAAILADVGVGDEVIMPSYTFVSTANAFVLRGAVPVFVDCRADNLNMDENAIHAAITEKTRAIVPVHYAGVACDMDRIMAIAERYNLLVIEDAAQGIMARYRGKPLGAIGHLGTYSFHETKNIISGEGGCLLVNDPAFAERAEIIREKGTDRSRFFRGEVDKYSWVDIGSSYLPSEVTAAFLWAQLQQAEQITSSRLASWKEYHRLCAPLVQSGLLVSPSIPPECQHNAHMYYILLPSQAHRQHVQRALKEHDILAVPHYVPLHSSPVGSRLGRASGAMTVTDDLSARLLRLPLWVGVQEHIPYIVQVMRTALQTFC